VRTVAVVVTGVFAGMLLGVLLGDLAAAALGPGEAWSRRPLLGLLVGLGPEVLAVVGGVLGWFVEARRPPGGGGRRRRR
jgi:hypothetical protein